MHSLPTSPTTCASAARSGNPCQHGVRPIFAQRKRFEEAGNFGVEVCFKNAGFPPVWWVTRHSIPNVIGLMGWCYSVKQAKLIVSLVKPSGRVWLMPDGDESGERCAETVLMPVSSHRFVRWVKSEVGKQPTDLSAGQLKTCFSM